MSGDFFRRFIELLSEAQPSISEEIALSIEQKLRAEFAGERVYIRKRDDNVHVLINDKFNGRNIEKLTRDMRVSRSTVYRAIRAHHKAR